MDYIVCWDINSEDYEAFSREGYNLSEITKPLLSNENDFSYLPISTHCLTIPSVKPLYIIDLKKVLDNLEKEE